MATRGITIILAALLAGLALPVAAQDAWTAEYHDNPDLAGQPVLIRREISPRGDWGAGSPHARLPQDGFSARWSTGLTLAADTYLLSVEGEGGLRVLINGTPVVDAWQERDGGLIQELLQLEAGHHRVVVEYLELADNARLIFNLDPLLPPPPADAPRARITARFLNMRDQSGVHGKVVEIISMNQVLPVVGRNGIGTWLELAFGERRAWVSAYYVEAENLESVRITDGSPAPVMEVNATVSAATPNLRELPDRGSQRLLQISRGERYPVIGRTPDGDWLWLEVGDIRGWAHSDWLLVSPGLETVPLLNADALLYDATITRDYLRVRAAPAPEARPLHIVRSGDVYPVIGRNAAATWVQLNTRGIATWADSTGLQVTPDLQQVPVLEDSRALPPAEAAAAEDDGSAAGAPASP